MATKKVIGYDSSHIQTLSGLSAIRTNCSMYIGSTDASGLFLIARELLDNSLDEHFAGRNNAVWMHTDTDGSYWVVDKGLGVPQGIKEVSMHVNGKDIINKIPTMQAIFGELHTSGKYKSDAYATSIGCFVGSTKLQLLDGTTVTFKDLYKRWGLDKTPIPIMTWDTKTDKVAYSNISHVQISKLTKKLVKVKFGGKVVKCTPEHPFYVRSDLGIIKVNAEDLQPGMSLVSENLKVNLVTLVTHYTLEEEVPVYDMTVDNQHTYFVDGVLVSNSHGIGSKGTNATSEYFNVTTFYKNKWYSVGFKKGVLTSPVTQLNKAPNGPLGKPLKSGTCIHYKPDSSIFSVKSFPPSMFVEWAEIMSYLNPGFAIISSNSKERKVYLSKEGTQEYVSKRIGVLKAESLNEKLFSYKSELADIVVGFTNYNGCDVRGFTSGLSNPDGGTHVNSVNTALYEGLKLALIKAKKKPLFSSSDFKEGLVGLINAKLHKAQYSSQDKSKLTDARTGLEFCKMLTIEATTFFNKNKDLALALHNRATQLNELKNSFNKSKKLVSALGVLKRKGMPADKYAPANRNTKVADREIYFIEGLSAGGTVKQARFAYQATLALKGKVMNACKAKEKTLESEEITYILGAIGFDPKASDPYEKLQVGKIILLSDPDPDGPLASNTRVLTLNGKKPTIGNLAKDWIKNPVPFEVFSRNSKNELVIGLASNPRQVILADETYTLHFDNGTKVECTSEHKWVPRRRHDKQAFINGIPYVATKDFKIGDGINSVLGVTTEKQAIKELGLLSNHTITKIVINKRNQKPMYCLTVEKYGNFMVDDGLGNGICSSNCHINTLLLALFYKYLPKLFEMGMVYVADTPEFYAQHKGEVYFGPTLSSVQAKIKAAKAPANLAIHHIKGWGEISAQLLRMLAMAPETRSLIKINELSVEDHDFDKLMNDDVAYRKELLGISE